MGPSVRFSAKSRRRAGCEVLNGPLNGQPVRPWPSWFISFVADGKARHLAKKPAQEVWRCKLSFCWSGLDPLTGRGWYTKDPAGALKGIGYKLGNIRASVPSIVRIRYDGNPDSTACRQDQGGAPGDDVHGGGLCAGHDEAEEEDPGRKR